MSADFVTNRALGKDIMSEKCLRERLWKQTQFVAVQVMVFKGGYHGSFLMFSGGINNPVNAPFE